ncbi:MAG: hypothetical protein U1A78_24615 [Polyangia bacterium]
MIKPPTISTAQSGPAIHNPLLRALTSDAPCFELMPPSIREHTTVCGGLRRVVCFGTRRVTALARSVARR